MYEIKIINPCSCAKKRKAWNKELVFETKVEAKIVANKYLTQGNENFCKRYHFVLNENGNILEIEAQLKNR